MREPQPADYGDYDSYRDAKHEWRYDQPDAETPEEARERMQREDELRRRPIVRGVMKK